MTPQLSAPVPEASPDLVRILMVDDRPENLLALEAVLREEGRELVKAHSGPDALRQLLQHEFAVILLDVMMPGMDGFETAALIRSREKNRNTPIIFITAINKTEDHIFKGYDLGAVDYLFKPVIPEVLRAKVSVFVELSRKTELLRRHAELLESRNRTLRHEVAQRRRAEEDARQLNLELERRVNERTAELKQSNEDLQQFAYVASHDLQEPLRLVSSYSQLLAKRHKGRLDAEADEFIGYIVEGVARMHRLISDLLEFSRVLGSPETLPGLVDCNKALDWAVSNLQVAVAESGAVITRDSMPEVVADEAQLAHVFQNLIGNAIKYRGAKPPSIHVTAQKNGPEWRFGVHDNGIGIEPQYFDRIFGLFKRLHGKEQPGTGLGLALCKRTVERMGGRIWVESQPGEGSSFYFTLPA